MKFDATNIAQDRVRHLSPYKPGMTTGELARTRGIRPDRIIKLASNENPFGMSPGAAAAIKKAAQHAGDYPDNHNLTAALAAHLGLKPENIILGSGSTEVLDLIARVFLGSGTEAISSQYAFAMYETLTRGAGADNAVVPAANFGHDLEQFGSMLNDATKVIWIANPNNPTGTFVPYSKVKKFVSSVPRHVIVVLDEAYYEYLDPAVRAESHQWINEHPNLVVVRTFSKAYGLAGLRIGYGIGHPSVIDVLNRIKQPCNVSGVGIAAAIAAIADQDHVKKIRRKNTEALSQLKRGLDKLGLSHLSTYGNFVTVKFDNAINVHSALLNKGIIVRPLSAYGMTNYLRISTGNQKSNELLLACLKQILHPR